MRSSAPPANGRPLRPPAKPPLHEARKEALVHYLNQNQQYGPALRLDGHGYKRLASWGFTRGEANALLAELDEEGIVTLEQSYGVIVRVVADDGEADHG